MILGCFEPDRPRPRPPPQDSFQPNRYQLAPSECYLVEDGANPAPPAHEPIEVVISRKPPSRASLYREDSPEPDPRLSNHAQPSLARVESS
jgi:hypothetical protein